MLIGFFLTVFFTNKANYRGSLENIEEITSLSLDSIYYQLSLLLNKPIDVGMTMSRDTLLIRLLEREDEHMDDENFVNTIKNYLEAYHSSYNFDSVFLVSATSGRYYNYNGLDRVLTPGNVENDWYFDFMASDREYSLNVDNDEVAGSGNAITVFINCKIRDDSGAALGIIGIGIKAEVLKSIINRYERSYDVEVALVDPQGIVEISDNYTGDQKLNFFDLHDIPDIKNELLDNGHAKGSRSVWTKADNNGHVWYFASRYVPVLSWYLVIGHNTSELIDNMKSGVAKSVFMLALVIACVLFIITVLIKNFNRHIVEIVEQRQKLFKAATEKLYDDIFEWNLTDAGYVGKNTERYLEGLGAARLPYDQALGVIAEKQIVSEFRRGYLDIFNSKNALRQFAMGNDHLGYEFQICKDGKDCHWMRIDAHIFYSPEDKSVHMFTYRRNIDAEKQKEQRANIDEMTQCYTKKATERLIDRMLSENSHSDSKYAFFIFDLDSFKQANDTYGHEFGDACIKSFAAAIKKCFREGDIVGRLGGDEFAAFIPFPSCEWLRAKCDEISRQLNFVCSSGNASWKISASIGISTAPGDGKSFVELYKAADKALYEVKRNGKNGFRLASRPCAGHVNDLCVND